MRVLREPTEQVATRQVVRRLMIERGQNVGDRRLVKNTMKRVAWRSASRRRREPCGRSREPSQ